MVNDIAAISASAVVPDQLAGYVAAVSGLETAVIEGCLLHHGGGFGILVAYPWNDSANQEQANVAVAKALEFPGLTNLTVLSAARPVAAPENVNSSADSYWFLDLPADKPSQKLANMLRRAKSEVEIKQEKWTASHAQLVKKFCQRKPLSDDSKYLFSQLEKYAACPDVITFSACDQKGDLAAFAMADYSSLSTAFYMFAFRRRDATPGSSDLLLQAIIEEANERGHSRLNLGLGIDPGVSFFKRKWGATPDLPFTETSWQLVKKPARSWLGRLFGK